MKATLFERAINLEKHGRDEHLGARAASPRRRTVTPVGSRGTGLFGSSLLRRGGACTKPLPGYETDFSIAGKTNPCLDRTGRFDKPHKKGHQGKENAVHLQLDIVASRPSVQCPAFGPAGFA